MLFNSFEFIFGLLPASVIVYFLAARFSMRLAIAWLVLVSLFFYAWWRPADLPLFLGSIAFNFTMGRYLDSAPAGPRRKVALWVGIVGNLALLGVFKYGPFAIENLNQLGAIRLPVPAIVLPLGISFFTFTQLTYLVDTYEHRRGGHPLPNYALFASFFPHLLAGPILHHEDMLPQFADPNNKSVRVENLWRGLCLFGVGLSKKTLLADALVPYVRFGFDQAAEPSLVDAWLATFAYAFQIYFDFSGYTDMAIGGALLFNIRLPVNFNSPYRSLDIQQFWRRWHITLGTFFRDYVYIPLGGNRAGRGRTLFNLGLTALASGFWHGAAWTFVFWGALHGGAMIVHQLWRRTSLRLPPPLAWVVMFTFILVTWVPFRAATWHRAGVMFAGLQGRHGTVLPVTWKPEAKKLNRTLKRAGVRFGELATQKVPELLSYLVLAALLAFWPRNSNRLVDPEFRLPLWQVAGIAVLTTASILNLNRLSEFIYFNF